MNDKEQLEWKLGVLEGIREELLGREHSSIRTVLNRRINEVKKAQAEASVEVVEG